MNKWKESYFSSQLKCIPFCVSTSERATDHPSVHICVVVLLLLLFWLLIILCVYWQPRYLFQLSHLFFIGPDQAVLYVIFSLDRIMQIFFICILFISCDFNCISLACFTKFECFDDLKYSKATVKLSRPDSQHEKLNDLKLNGMVWNTQMLNAHTLFFFFAFLNVLNEGWNFSSHLRKNQLSNAIYVCVCCWIKTI